MAKYKRSVWNVFTIKSKTQLKFVLLLLFCMFIPSVFVGICMYYFIFKVVTEGAGVPEPIAYNLFPILRQVNLTMGIGLFVIFVMFLMIGLYVSHKLIGPIHRLRRELRQILEGDFNHRIKMRKGDDLLFVADSVNQLLDKMKS